MSKTFYFRKRILDLQRERKQTKHLTRNRMTTITTTQIQNRLRESFQRVDKFVPLDSGVYNAPSVTTRVITSIVFMGLSLVVIVFTNDNQQKVSNDTAEYRRAVILCGQNKAYYF